MRVSNVRIEEPRPRAGLFVLTDYSSGLRDQLLGLFPWPAPRSDLALPSQFTEMVATVLIGRGTSADMAHGRCGGHSRLLDEIGGEGLGRVEKFKATRGAVLGKGDCGGNQEFNSLQHVFEGLE